MDEPGGNLFESIKNPVRKKRSYTFRRSHSESQQAQETNGVSSLSTTPTSDDASKGSSEDTMGAENDSRRKDGDLNLRHTRDASASVADSETYCKRSKREDVSLEVIYGNTSSFRESNELLRSNVSSEEVLSTAARKTSSEDEENTDSHKFLELNNSKKNGESYISGPSGASDDGFRSEGKVKKVKLKVGGVTRMIDGNANSSRNSQSAESDMQRHRHIHKDGSDYEPSRKDKRIRLKGIPWKDFPSGGFTLGKDALARESLSRNQFDRQGQEKSDAACKNRRSQKKPQKKHVLDDTSDGEDDEIRYLEKLKNSRSSGGARGNPEDPGKKRRRLLKLSGEPVNVNVKLHSGKEGKQNVICGDNDYEGEDEDFADGESEGGKKNNSQKEYVDSFGEANREVTLTTRQRALRNKDASAPGGNNVDFPNGLPPVPPRKQKDKLTDVELQLKKAEAAQRRKLQNEKAARASEAEAIKKILGQDSNRKKREEKKKKRQEELAQEKAANVHAANTVRWIMGPNGTTVVFPKEMGLPGVFDPKPNCYPPPREKCAGPSCGNPYRYRDSKSKLPLCSLGCYKAVQAKDHTIVRLGLAGDAVSAH